MMAASDKEIIVRLPPIPYHRLQAWARQAGKTPESLTQEIVERAVAEKTAPQEGAEPLTARQILEATGRVTVLSVSLKQKIIPGVKLEAVRTTLDHTGGPTLSEILLEQRESSS
jgi:hypothetical protein